MIIRSTDDSKKLFIQVFRCLAVISVVIFHFDRPVLPGGYYGVDVFFTISGFVVYASYSRNNYSAMAFFVRRIFRLLPALLATVILALLISFVFSTPEILKITGYSSLYSITGISNFYFWGNSGYFSAPPESYLLLHTWSLSVEWQFYVIFSLLIVAAALTGIKHIITALLGVLTLISLASYTGYNPLFPDQGPDEIFYSIVNRFWQIGVGALAGVAYDRIRAGNALAFSASLIVFTACFVTVVLAGTQGKHVPVILSFLIVLTFVFSKNLDTAPSFPLNLFVFIGNRSYSIYLIHWPVFAMLVYLNIKSNFSYFLFGFVFTILFSEILFRNFERKIKFLGRKSLSWMLIGMAVAIAAICGLFIHKDGLPGRITKLQEPRLNEDWKKTDGLGELVLTSDKFSFAHTITNKAETTQLKFLVIGDSHADHLHWLGRELMAHFPVQWTTAWYMGCPPVFGYHKYYDVSKERGLEREKGCEEQVMEWEKYVRKHGHEYDYVVLASRWNWLFNDKPFMGRPIRRDRLAPMGERGDVSQDKSREYFIAGINRTIEIISKTGANVILAEQAPMSTKRAEECDKIPFAKYMRRVVNCDLYSYRDIADRGQFVSDVFGDIAGRHDNVSVLPVAELLCAKGVCDTYIDGYRISDDTNHLNGWGGKVLAERWVDSDF